MADLVELNQSRRDWRDHRRVPLLSGPFFSARTLVVVFLQILAPIGAMVALLLASLSYDLVPRTNSFAVGATIVWLMLATLAAIIGLLVRQARRLVCGWITAVDEQTLRVDLDGASTTLTLAYGAVRLRPLKRANGSPQYAQLDVKDTAFTLHLWGAVGWRERKLLKDEQAPAPQGLMAAGSIGPLCRWLAPYLSPQR